MTTMIYGRHIKTFCGLNKAQYMNLQSKGEMI